MPSDWVRHPSGILFRWTYSDGPEEIMYQVDDSSGRWMSRLEFEALTSTVPRNYPTFSVPGPRDFRLFPASAQTTEASADNVTGSFGDEASPRYEYRPRNAGEQGRHDPARTTRTYTDGQGRRIYPATSATRRTSTTTSGGQHVSYQPQLTPLAQAFAQLEIGDFNGLGQFVLENRGILAQPEIDNLLSEAAYAQRAGRGGLAQKYVHHAVLLQKCSKCRPEALESLFQRLATKGETARDLFADVSKAHNSIKSRYPPPGPQIPGRVAQGEATAVPEQGRSGNPEPQTREQGEVAPHQNIDRVESQHARYETLSLPTITQDHQGPLRGPGRDDACLFPAEGDPRGHGTTSTLISRTRSADAGISSQPTSRTVNSADQSERLPPAQKPQLGSLAPQLRQARDKDGQRVYVDSYGREIRPAGGRHESQRSRRDSQTALPTEKMSEMTLDDSGGYHGHETSVHTGGKGPTSANPRPEQAIDSPIKPPGVWNQQRQRYSIEGTAGDSEALDADYIKRWNPKEFFARGKVFALLWHQSRTGKRPKFDLSKDISVTRGPFQQEIHSSIRRMVVVKEGHGYCWCLMIYTYGERGVLKPGLSDNDRKAHAVVHMTGALTTDLQDGRLMNKEPIAVDPASPDQKLNKWSRLDFRRVYTVEHNVKVKDIGHVATRSMPYLMTYFKEVVNEA